MTAIVLENVILSHPHLFEAKQYKGTGAFRYSANFIFPQNYDFTTINALVAAARTEKGLPDTVRTPLSQVKEGPYKGFWQISSYAYEFAPQVVDQALQPVMDRGQIWAGCRVNANVDIYGYNNAGDGVTAGVTHVMVVDNVPSEALPRLDNRKDAADVFQPIAGAPVATAPGAPGGMPGGAPGGAPAGVPAAGAPAAGAPAATTPGMPPAGTPNFMG
jgi:hypothetical protein